MTCYEKDKLYDRDKRISLKTISFVKSQSSPCISLMQNFVKF